MGIVKNILYTVANSRFLSLVKKQPIFPYYHIVRDDKVIHVENLYSYKNVSQFKNDMDLLLKHYKTMDPLDLFTTNTIPDNSFLLTFDDGLEEIYSVIFPILREKKIKAIFFLNPDFVDNKQTLYKHDISIIINHLKQSDYNPDIVAEVASVLAIEYSSISDFIEKVKKTKFSDSYKLKEVMKVLNIDVEKFLNEQKPYITKDQIQEMINEGHLFGGHTMSHPPLIQLDFEEQKNQIIDSVAWVKKYFELNYSLFAFPFSDKNISKKLIEELFQYDPKIVLFGNAGIKQDIDKRLIQRFSLENPDKETGRQIVTENLYKYYNRITGKYHIKRK